MRNVKPKTIVVTRMPVITYRRMHPHNDMLDARVISTGEVLLVLDVVRTQFHDIVTLYNGSINYAHFNYSTGEYVHDWLRVIE